MTLTSFSVLRFFKKLINLLLELISLLPVDSFTVIFCNDLASISFLSVRHFFQFQYYSIIFSICFSFFFYLLKLCSFLSFIPACFFLSFYLIFLPLSLGFLSTLIYFSFLSFLFFLYPSLFSFSFLRLFLFSFFCNLRISGYFFGRSISFNFLTFPRISFNNSAFYFISFTAIICGSTSN